jgi:hypothetical protein
MWWNMCWAFLLGSKLLKKASIESHELVSVPLLFSHMSSQYQLDFQFCFKINCWKDYVRLLCSGQQIRTTVPHELVLWAWLCSKAIRFVYTDSALPKLV